MANDSIADFWNKKVNEKAKHVAICNIGHVALQQKYILLGLNFFKESSRTTHKKIAVVSFDFSHGIYKDFVKVHNPHFLQVPNSTGYDFLSWTFLLENDIPESFFENYDLVIWDLPDLNFIQSKSQRMERYFSMFKVMDIVSLPQNGTDESNQINRINNYFNCHGFKFPQMANQRERAKKHPFVEVLRKVAGF